MRIKGGPNQKCVLWQKLTQKHSNFLFLLFILLFCIFVKFSMYFTYLGLYLGGFCNKQAGHIFFLARMVNILARRNVSLLS